MACAVTSFLYMHLKFFVFMSVHAVLDKHPRGLEQESGTALHDVHAARAAHAEAGRCDGCGQRAVGVRLCAACKRVGSVSYVEYKPQFQGLVSLFERAFMSGSEQHLLFTLAHETRPVILR